MMIPEASPGAVGTVTILVIYLLWKVIQQVMYFFRSNCDMRTSRATISHRTYSAKVVWLTESTTAIGRALAHTLASKGSLLILSSSDPVALDKLLHELPCPADRVHVFRPTAGAAAGREDARPAGASVHSARELREDVACIFGRLDVVVVQAWGLDSTDARLSAVPADQLTYDSVTRAAVDAFVNPICSILPLIPALSANPDANGLVIALLPVCAILPTARRGLQTCTAAAMAAMMSSLVSDEPLALDVVNVYVGDVDGADGCAAAQVGKDGTGEKLTGDSVMDNFGGGRNARAICPFYAADRILAAASDRLNCAIVAPAKDMMRIRLYSWFPALFESVYLGRPLFPIPSRFHRLPTLFSTCVRQSCNRFRYTNN